MKLFRTTDSPSWPALLADCPIKIGTNTIRDMVRANRIVCRLHAPGPAAAGETATATGPAVAASGVAGIGSYYAEISLAELARFAHLHAAVTAMLADPEARKDSGADDGGGALPPR